jgi:hypothetical protein
MRDELSEAVFGDVKLVRVAGHRDLDCFHGPGALEPRRRAARLLGGDLHRRSSDRATGGEGVVEIARHICRWDSPSAAQIGDVAGAVAGFPGQSAHAQAALIHPAGQFGAELIHRVCHPPEAASGVRRSLHTPREQRTLSP